MMQEANAKVWKLLSRRQIYLKQLDNIEALWVSKSKEQRETDVECTTHAVWPVLMAH